MVLLEVFGSGEERVGGTDHPTVDGIFETMAARARIGRVGAFHQGSYYLLEAITTTLLLVFFLIRRP